MMGLYMTDVQIEQALREIGISSRDFTAVRRSQDLEEASRRLRVLKADAKRGYRQAAIRLHPDRNSGDAAKEELFKIVSEAYRKIQALRIRPSRPDRRRPRNSVGASHRSGVRVRIRVN